MPTGRRTLAALLVAACIPVSRTYAGGMPSPAPLGQVGSPANFANGPLPDNVALDESSLDIGSATAPRVVTVNPAVPAEIQHEANAYGTYFNQAIYTAPMTVVPAGQSLTPVGCVYGSPPRACAARMRWMMAGVATDGATDLHGGLPIPDDYIPPSAADSDAEAVFYQPAYVSPAGYRGRFFEAFDLRRNPAYDPALPVGPTNPRWTASSGGRVVGTATAPGHYVNRVASGYRFKQPGDPDSTYQEATWGVLAGGTYIASDEIRRLDCLQGAIDHEVGLLVRSNRRGHRWPAQRDDGWQPHSPLMEGMRLRFPVGMRKPAFSNRLASMLFAAAQRYGLIIDDRTGYNVAVRVEPLVNGVAGPECAALLDGVDPHHALDGFPWARLQVLAVGSDRVPNPPAVPAAVRPPAELFRRPSVAFLPLAAAGAITIDRVGVTVRSRNPGPTGVKVVRVPSGTLVWGGRVLRGQRVVLKLPGARYRACAYQPPASPYAGFHACADARYRTTPRLHLRARRRGASVRLRIGADPLLAGSRATVRLRGSGIKRRRVVRLTARPVRLRLTLPRHTGRIRVTITAHAPKDAGELLLRTARAGRTV